MITGAAPPSIFGAPFRTTPGRGIFGQMPDFGQVNPSPATVGGLPRGVVREYPPSGDFVFGPQDYPIGEDPLSAPQVQVMKLTDVGVSEAAISGSASHTQGQIIILASPKDGAASSDKITLRDRIKRSRNTTSDLETPTHAIFDRIESLCRAGADWKPTIATVLVADTTDVEDINPTAHYSVAFGGGTPVRTYDPRSVETLLTGTFRGDVAASELWNYLERNVEPYNKKFTSRQIAQNKQTLSVFPILEQSATGKGIVHYIPVLSVDIQIVNNLRRLLRKMDYSNIGRGIECRKFTDEVYRIGTLLQSYCEHEPEWVVEICPQRYFDATA